MSLRVDVLLSYAYVRGALGACCDRMLRAGLSRVMFDSGAFTAHRRAKQVDLAAYIEFIKARNDAGEHWGAVQLDVIGNSEGTTRNLDTMVRAGVKPMPVLTTDMPIERVDALVQINARTCIAGALGRGVEGLADLIADRYRYCKKRCAGAEFHGLAFVRWPALLQCGLASVDSSSHGAGARYGLAAVWDPTRGISTLPRAMVLNHGPRNARVNRFLRITGLTRAQAEDDGYYTSGMDSVTALTYAYAVVMQANEARRRGVIVFHAASNIPALMTLACAARFGRQDGTWLDLASAKAAYSKLRRMQASERDAVLVQWLGGRRDP